MVVPSFSGVSCRAVVQDNRGYVSVRIMVMLPDGYRIERDADVLSLLRSDGSVVARFSVLGVQWSEVERTAEQDARRTTHRTVRRVPIHSRHKPVQRPKE